MDDVMVRPRHVRNNIAVRKRRKNPKISVSLAERIVRQIMICLVILIAVGLIKSINTPVTNYLSDKFKTALFEETNLKSIYRNFNGILGKIGLIKEKEAEGDAVSASADLSAAGTADEDDSVYESTGDKISEKVEVASGEVAGNIKENYEFVLPVNGVVTSGFGDGTDAEGVPEFHTGIDIEAESGSSVCAALDGEVVLTGASPAYGKFIEIDHGDGLTTLYAHCLNILVEKGQKVQAGEAIAEVGNAGVSVGSHLHFEVMKDGKYLNPADCLRVPIE